MSLGMSDFDKRISGDWIDVRESASDFYTLNDRFKIAPAQMLAERQALGLANEEGLVEHKRGYLVPVFTSLENMAYKALSNEDLAQQVEKLHLLLFITMLQRCVVLGTVPLTRSQDQPSSPDTDFGLKLVLADVQKRIRQDPELQKHQAVKNILAHVKRYQNEMAKMKELEPKIKGDARVTFVRNFRDTFRDIADSVRKNYAELLKEDRAAGPQQESSLVRRLPIKSLSPVVTQQAIAYSRMRSTVSFAMQEKFKTRELLVGVYRQRGQILKLLDDELAACARLYREHVGETPDSGPLVSKSFGYELALILERQAKMEQT